MKFFLKETSFLVITLLIIANFLLGNIVLAKGIKITDKDIGMIKTGLSLMKALVNYTIGDNTLKTALNMTIGGGETGADITYGLIVLTAINEMDFIDMVVSQRYKQEATAYFNQVINERTNLMSYWKGIGYDLPRVAMGYVTSPMAGLTLNSFSITDKIISIFTAFNVIKREKIYDGLWYYFSLRRENKESHKTAWEEAEIIIGWAVKPTSFFNAPEINKNKGDQLESQFAALWDKWGTYTDSKGVTKAAKEQFGEEMGQIVAEAIEKQVLAEKSKEPSLLSKAVEASKNFIKNVAETVKNTALNIISAIKSTVSQFNPFGAGVTQPLLSLDQQDEEAEEIEEISGENTEVGPLQVSQREIGGPRPLDDVQEQLDDIAERIDILDAETAKLIKEKDVKEEKKENELTEEEETKKEEEIIKEPEEELEEATDELEVGQNAGQKLCEKIGGAQPTRNKVIFNEIAWMGSVNSPNGEWIELKNISGSEIDLAGWQILNKSDNIKIVFSGGQTSANAAQSRVLSGGFFLLERTGDDSAPRVKADFIYTGALKNSEETIYLFDENCWFQDIVAVGSDWPAGDNSSKRTMERRQDFDWQTSANAGGTPKTGNSSGYFVSYGGSGTLPPPPPSPPPPPTYPKILISEIQIGSASGTDDEFIELYNPNEEEVNLSNWSIQKTYCNSATVYKKNFEAENKIPAKGYFLIVYASSTDQNLLNLADMTHKTFSLTENNTIYLVVNQEKIENASDIDIIDMIGFGMDIIEFRSLPAEGDSSALNPSEDKSTGRKWSTTAESYVDTDNNSQDFEIQTPTPKAQNQSLENQLPSAIFTFLPQNPSVSEEILFDASSSTDPDGQITSYLWDFGDGTTATTSQSSATCSYSTSGVEYLVELLVVDNQGATSSATTTISVIEPNLAQNVIISETLTAGNEEFVELYNPTIEPVSMADWYLSYFSQNKDWNDPYLNKEFPATSTVATSSYYLVAFGDYPETDSNPEPDWKPYESHLSDDVGAIGIFSCNPKIATTSTTTLEEAIVQASACKIDVVAWRESETSSEPTVKEATSTIASPAEKSLGRKKNAQGEYIDSDNNSRDFEIQNPSPINSKGLPPEAISDFQIVSSANNIVDFTWSSPHDPDTAPENLSFKVYYSRNEELREENLNATSTLSATTSATSFNVSDLYYNSTYYFGVKAFDGQNLSFLSTTSPWGIPSALIDSPWPNFQVSLQRTGQSGSLGPQATPTIAWVYDKEDDPGHPDWNPLYTSPIIRPEGTIFSSVIYPSDKKGILALNSDGSKKWFQKADINSPLALQPDGSVLADDISRAWSNDETVYYFGQNDILYAFDKAGNEKWQKQFGFIEPQGDACASTTPLVLTPAVGKEGIIYVVVRDNSCTPDYKLDYLYALSPENGNSIWQSNLGGYNSSLPTVSADNIVSVFSLTYPKYAFGPSLWLKNVSNGEIKWAKPFDNNFKSLPIIDSQGNIYFSIGKKVYGFDKAGKEIWQIYLGNAPTNWENVGDNSGLLALSADGTLYLTGRGAILGLKLKN